MPRGFVVNRISEEGAGYQKESYDNLTPWMRRVMDQISRKQQSAVEQGRARQSIVNQVNNLMANPPRYATVDDAVADMRERTGLNHYLNKVQASEDKKKRIKLRNTVANIMGDSDKKIPDSLEKYNISDQLIQFIRNIIQNGHGLSAQIPHLQDEILRNFSRTKNIAPEDVLNDEVQNFLSDLIFEEQSQLPQEQSNYNIGIGLGRNEEPNPEDQDYFSGLMPASR